MSTKQILPQTASNEPTRRQFLKALAILPAAALPTLSFDKVEPPTPNLYQACIDLTGQGIDLAMAAMKLRDGNGTAEEARAELAMLKAAVDAIVI